MRQLLIAVFLVVLVAAGATAAAAALGVGPFAPAAAGSVVYVAISRSTDEADAREIEVIDLAACTRDLIDAGGRISAMVLSVDRRSLYVAVDAGRIEFLDARTGTRFAEVDLRGPTVTSLVVDPSGLKLYAVAVTNQQSSIVPIDLDARKAGDPITLPPGAGSAVLRGDTLIVPVNPRALEVQFLSVSKRAVTDHLTLPRGSLVAPAVVGVSASLTAIVGFDPTGGGAGAIRVFLVQDALHWQDVTLPAPFGSTPARGGQAAVFAAASSTGVLQVCVPAGGNSRRYIVTQDRKSAIAGGECGPMAGGADILLARRDPAQLLVLDPTTGRTTRTLPLAGVPARLTR